MISFYYCSEGLSCLSIIFQCLTRPLFAAMAGTNHFQKLSHCFVYIKCISSNLYAPPASCKINLSGYGYTKKGLAYGLGRISGERRLGNSNSAFPLPVVEGGGTYT